MICRRCGNSYDSKYSVCPKCGCITVAKKPSRSGHPPKKEPRRQEPHKPQRQAYGERDHGKRQEPVAVHPKKPVPQKPTPQKPPERKLWPFVLVAILSFCLIIGSALLFVLFYKTEEKPKKDKDNDTDTEIGQIYF